MRPRIDRIEYVFGFTAGLAVASVAALLVIWPWGMWVGQRDARLLMQADRQAAVGLCTEQERAVLITGQYPIDDVWVCAGGSGRLLNKARAPLGSPLAKGEQR